MSFCCFTAEAKFSTWKLLKLASNGKFDFSKPDLDGNKLGNSIVCA